MIKLNLDEATLQKLGQSANANNFNFLGFTIDLKKCLLTDNLGQTNAVESELAVQVLTILLSHYSLAKVLPSIGKLIKFKDLPGGYAYEVAFIKRVIKPIEEVFGEKPKELSQAAKLLGGRQMKLGDVSFEMSALKGIPLTYVLWKTGEFSASANVFYDETASNYLPTEDLAVLGEVTTLRLIEAKKQIERQSRKDEKTICRF